MVYCRSNLKIKLLAESANSETEFIISEVSDGVSKVLVSCVYNPNKSCMLDLFFDELAVFLLDYERYIICGDFNVNLLVNDSYTSKLYDKVSEGGLVIVNKSLPTRYANNANPSLLDIFISSDLKHILKFDQIFFVSDHDLIFCSLDVALNRRPVDVTFTYRDFKSINVSELFCDLSRVCWDDCWFYESVDKKLDFLNRNLLAVFNVHVPIRSVRPMNPSCPWYTRKVCLAIKSEIDCMLDGEKL